ncbi:MAG: aminotransferase class I/II-fold pyridoxal phosphate-dependent enzyme [Solirubrobacteraceae bacterium]
MEAIILAAGCARRMRPISLHRHKALLPVARSTILARIVDELEALDVDVINVVTGYRADEVKRYLCTECPGPTYRFLHNARYETTNNIVSLALALDAIHTGRDVVLVECDLILGPGLLRRLAGADRGNVALLDHYRTGMDGTVATVRDGVVAQVVPPELQDDGFDYRNTYKTLNVYRFSADFCRRTLRPLLHAHVSAGGASSYYEIVLAALGDLAPHRIAAEIVAGERWAEVDDPHDLAAARFQFEPEHRGAMLDQRRGGQWSFEMLDFTFMRNAYFPTEAMLAAMRYSLADLLDNYGSTQAVLNQKLAWFLECDESRLQTLNGASQVFPILRRLWADRTVAVPAPTFGEYARAFPQARRYPDSPGVAARDLERVAGETGVVVVVNPNNPTGTTLDNRELHALAARHPRTTFLIDESFIAFSDQDPMLRELELAPLGNVIVLSSLSKALGVPGLRIGYVYSADLPLLDRVSAEIPIWNTNAVAEYFIELLLKFRPQLSEALELTKRDREVFRRDLTNAAPVAEVAPSGANFLLVRLHGREGVAGRLRQALLTDEAISLKDVTGRFGDGLPRLRVAVRLPHENERLVQAMSRVGAEQAAGSPA